MSYDEDGNGRGVAVALTRDWTRRHRPMATRSPGWRSAVLLCGLLVLGLSLSGLAHAQALEVQNTLVSKGLPSDTGNGSSSPAALSSADGRYVLFSSHGASFVSGIVDFNNVSDVFLHDRATQATVLVSRSATSATTTANSFSTAIAISADGEWVLFQSSATNLVSGVSDSNSSEDAFLYQRSTGAVSLVSRSAASATMTANFRSSPAAISADGEWVLFGSLATDLVPGVTDSNLSNDVFLYQRSTGLVTLVTRSAASATTAANDSSFPNSISADGEWVLFGSNATNLVSGVTDGNGSGDAFLYQRSTGAMSLISRSAASATATADGPSFPTSISANGEWVLFRSVAGNLVSGVTDNRPFTDVFLYQRSTGVVSLVTRSAASPTTPADRQSNPIAISADGEWVLFHSLATNLVSGLADSNGSNPDVFLYQRSTETVRLVSRSAASATTTADGSSVSTAMSADGEWVLFRSSATNLVPGVTDSNQSDDVFLYQRSTGAMSLVTPATSATTTANNQSAPTAITLDGEWVLFASAATNLVSGLTDTNDADDLFLYQRSTGAVSLVSGSTASAATTANHRSAPTAISADGEWVLFQSNATDLVSGVTDRFIFIDVFLYQRSTGALSLVSRSAASAMSTANGDSVPIAISADGEWVLFQSDASNLVSGVTDFNQSNDVFLYQRSTGTVSLVSRSAAAAATANGKSAATAISANGEWVLFGSNAADLVSGVTDSNQRDDVFLYQRSTGTVSLVSRSAASATTTASNGSFPAAISSDGEWVLFESLFANDLVPGATDNNGSEDVFLYQRSTGAVSLVSRSAASATTAANSVSNATAISADGEWMLFGSDATNLVSRVTDSNWAMDVFLYQRRTGAVSLVSRAAASATTAAGGFSVPTAISVDGEWVLFSSTATNLVAGGSDGNFSQDVYLYQRSTGAVSLVSRSAASATIAANAGSNATAISADGERVLFESYATNLVSEVVERNESVDVYMYQRSTGAVSLLSRSAASATTTLNGFSEARAISANGESVLIVSGATDIAPSVLDGNGTGDVVLARVVDPNKVFANGFESLIPGTTAPADAP